MTDVRTLYVWRLEAAVARLPLDRLIGVTLFAEGMQVRQQAADALAVPIMQPQEVEP